jgi:dTDP-4-dehydrorhamnose 3,5-epimerase-like enzyme
VEVIAGNIHRDERGVVRFVNNFDMRRVVRMYCIEPKFGVIRAWQGHRKETKWFYAAKGSFLVKTIAMDTMVRKEYFLIDKKSNILKISGGYYNGFEALEENSVLIVFSDFSLNESKKDDYRVLTDQLKW